MSADPARYVLDSYALLAFLQGEAGMDRVKEVLRAAEQDTCRVYLSWINLGEVLYITERSKGLLQAREMLAMVEALPVELLETSSQYVLEAAHIKANHRLSYADAFAAVAALRENAVLLTGDPEFECVEEIIRVEWLVKNK